MKTNVAFFYGCRSVEHEVSIISAVQAMMAINKEKYDVTPVYVTKDGEMYMGAVANSLIFRFDWENEEFDLVGQAGTGGRVSTMDEDDNGIIWLGAGHPTMHLVRFDKNATGKDRFIDYGEVNNSNYRCYFHASYYYKNKLYLGETDGFTPSLHVIDLEDL